MKRVLLLLLPLLLLTACLPKVQPSIERIPAENITSEAVCLEHGGSWRTYFPTGSTEGSYARCFLPTLDAGKRCIDSSQCETLCVTRDKDAKVGECYHEQIVQGSFYTLRNAKTQGLLIAE